MKHAGFFADDMIRWRSPSTSHPGWEMPGGYRFFLSFFFVRLIGLMMAKFSTGGKGVLGLTWVLTDRFVPQRRDA
jgi:hypothetical protein